MERGKSRKGLIIVVFILFMAAGAGVCCLCLLRAHAADENKEPILEEGQEYTYAKITSISGNEIEYTILDAQKVEFSNMQGKGRGSKGAAAQDGETPPTRETSNHTGSMPSGSEMPEMGSMPTGGGMPEMGSMSTGGGMPEMGGMPSGGGMPDMANMPTGGGTSSGDRAERNEKPGAQKYPNQDSEDNTQNAVVMTYTETDETGQMQIPVGTEVETKLGTITTFSRLSNGDIIKMLLQKDDAGTNALLKIWIME